MAANCSEERSPYRKNTKKLVSTTLGEEPLNFQLTPKKLLIWKLMGSPPLMCVCVWEKIYIYIYIFYKGIALPNNLLQFILKSEINWKSCLFFLKKGKKTWNSSEWLELPNSDFLVNFQLFWPKVGFFLNFKTCSFRWSTVPRFNSLSGSNRVIHINMWYKLILSSCIGIKLYRIKLN